VDAGLGVRIALHADRLRGPLRVRRWFEVRWPRTGSPRRVANAAVAFDALEAFQVETEFAGAGRLR